MAASLLTHGKRVSMGVADARLVNASELLANFRAVLVVALKKLDGAYDQ